jgi:hypothetical protein
MAYGKIYGNAGALTHGVTDETPDGMSLDKIDRIIEALRYERYQWLPARRVYIPKKNGKKRPLGMPVWSDKLVQEVMRLILEAYYEPQFFSQITHTDFARDAAPIPHSGKSTTTGGGPRGSSKETSRNASTN